VRPIHLVAALCAACHVASSTTPVDHARKLHFDAIVVDGHNDITTPILDRGFDLGMDGAAPDAPIRTQTDIARMKRGGLDAEFFSIYVDPDFVGRSPAQGGGAARRALDMIDAVYEQLRRHPDSLELARTADDVVRIAGAGKVAVLMGIEGGHAIEDSLSALRIFHYLGVRYMTLTHFNSNDWADSSGDSDDPSIEHHHGLNEFGKRVVLEMNRIGMMVDISHVSDDTFWAAIRTSQAPVIASHSSARAIAPVGRNLSDEMLRAVAKNGGVVMVNFFDAFLDPAKATELHAILEEQKRLKAQYPNDGDKARAELEGWVSTHRIPGRIPLSRLVEHIDHIVAVAGIDHVGIGSDYDGLPSLDAVPAGLDDVAGLPALTAALVQRGYSDADVKKILGGNLLRVMRECEAVAARMRSGGRS
jgi:membrane dipeptidase